MSDILEVDNLKKDQLEEHSLSRTMNGFLLLLFIGCSFLVFNVGGYNTFIPSDMRLLTRIAVAGIMFISTYILYRSQGEANRYWKISFSFLIASIGLLMAWFFGTWYYLIPGLSPSTVEGAAIAKVAEALPIILSIMIGIWMVEKDFTPVYVQGGDLRRSIKLGLIASPAALFPFIALGGLGFSASLEALFFGLPWIFLFSFSNGLMEELMIRGIFLREYDSLFGQTQSLILTSVIFAIFHQAIIGITDIITLAYYFSIPLIMGLIWGYIIQKSDNIWGAVLAHMIADVLFFLVMFGV
ncbi:MAG: CPBP family intramembrane glutamic endopeptidase [Candidatus Thorarchaeota archaeon]